MQVRGVPVGGRHVPGWRPPAHYRARRTALVAAAAFTTINIWTGAPLLAVWIGSRAQGLFAGPSPGSGASMGAIVIVVVVLAALELGLTVALTRLSAAHDELTGRPHTARRTSPWLRSMRGEREELARKRAGISAVERVVVVVVVAALLAFEAWFFFLAGSPLPST